MPQKLGDKTSFPLSRTTNWRERSATAPEIVKRGFTNMAVDFSRQQSVMPNSLGATMNSSRPMNASGRPKALDVMMGGAPDCPPAGPTQNQPQRVGPQKGGRIR